MVLCFYASSSSHQAVRREDAAACGEKRVFPNVLSCSFYRQPKACCKIDWKLCLHSSCRKVLNGYEVFRLEFKAKPYETFGCVMLEMVFFHCSKIVKNKKLLKSL